MKDYNELIKSFDTIKELPVSEEMLGAYLENTLSGIELSNVEDVMSTNPFIAEILEDANNLSYFSDADDLWINSQSVNGLSDLVYQDSDIYPANEDEFYIDDIDDSIISHHYEIANNIINTVFDMGINSSTNLESSIADRLFGEEGNGSSPIFDPMIFQGPEGVCAIRSQQIILRDYGVDIPLEDLKQYAIEQGWYDAGENGGTPMMYVGSLLEACGISMRQDVNCTVYDLVNELAQGHRVIVGVDANELWAERSNNYIGQLKESFKDLMNEGANHALVVAGVEVNPNSPEDVKVILTDPGTGDLRIEYTLDGFMDAWEDSNCFMATTTTPAPLQYDALHGRMIPSNFAVEQFVDANSLPLNADVRIPEEYLASPAYYSEGHLDYVGHDSGGNEISYDDYSTKFAECRQLFQVQGSFGQDHFDRKDFIDAFKNLFCKDDEIELDREAGVKAGSGVEIPDEGEDGPIEPESLFDDNENLEEQGEDYHI